MRIFLIGFMGSGKTTIGEQLAIRLNYKFIDMDDYIVENEVRSINDIFEKDGEDVFRKIEQRAVHNLCKIDNVVIGSGGGAPCFFDNMDQMNKYGETFYLKMDTNGLVGRLYNATNERPLVKGKSKTELKEFIDEILIKREPFYSKAKYTIQAENMRVDDFLPYLNIS